MLAEHADDVLDLGAGDALVAEEFVHGDAAGHGGLAVAHLAGVLEDFAQQAGAVLDAAAVLVGAVVVAPRQEVVQAADGVPGVDVDDVVFGLHRPADRLAVPVPQVGDVGLGHLAGLHRVVVPRHHRQVLRAQRGLAADQVRAVEPVVRQLDAGQRAALVDLVRDACQRGQVLVVPESQFDERADVRGRVDLDLFGADHGPAALGLDLAHVGLAGRIAVTHAVAVRHLVEAVARGDRADLAPVRRGCRIGGLALELAPGRRNGAERVTGHGPVL